MGKKSVSPIRRRRRTASMLALMLVLGAPAAHAQLRPAAPPLPAAPQLMITNKSPHPIEQIYVAPSTMADWGDDKLNGNAIAPGAARRFSMPSADRAACRVDIQVVYGNNTVEERHDVDVCHTASIEFDGGRALATTAAADSTAAIHPIALVNHAGRPIEQIFISEPSAEQWGDERLAGPAVAVNETRKLTYAGGCTADLRVVFDNRAAEERRDVDVCGNSQVVISPGWTTAGPPNADVQPPVVQTLFVTNRSKNAVTEIRLVPDGTPIADAHDLLAGQKLPRDGHVILPFMRGKECKFTAQIVYAGTPQPRDLGSLDLCHTSTITLPPS